MHPCLCCLCQFLNLPSECCGRNGNYPDQETFSTVQFWWACANCGLNCLSLADKSGLVWSSAAVSHLFEGLMCALRWSSTYFGCNRRYLTYCCLSISSKYAGNSPLTSINKTFSPRELPLTEYFLFFRPFSVSPSDGSAWKSQYIISVCRNVQTSLSGTNNNAMFNVT